uniref:Putative cytidylyltransferase n=1 Tax=viral metagenome TaxID=1070528 RepID=A0A6M3JRN7_9ZZZZ
MKTAAIIQARIESTRMPGKILLPLAGEMALVRVIERVAQARGLDEIIVVCPDTAPNGVLRAIQMRYVSDNLLATNFKIYAGPAHNVIKRVLLAANYYKADIIVDVTSDCPLVDPQHIEALLGLMMKNKFDYASNVHPRSWPDGFDVQIYTLEALECAYRAVMSLPASKRVYHSGWNIMHHREDIEKALGRSLSAHNYRAPKECDRPSLGLTLDTAEDFDVLCHVYDHFHRNPRFTAEEVIGWLARNPHLVTNGGVRRKTPEEG